VIRLEAGGEEPGYWDPERLSQALGNLIGNAVQHGGDGNAVTVTLTGGKEHVAVAVHNRGPSIPSAQLDGIFNPMRARLTPATSHRAVTSAKLASGGPTGSLGLGLYIAERIVAAHEGRLDVSSSEASGTTFTLHLPRVVNPPVA
jgi:signal transduction histidine kinase